MAELDAGNVHLFVAGAVALLLRGRALGILPVALTKFASVAAIPAALRCDPRGLALGALLGIAVSVVSFALSPAEWMAYARFLLTAVEPNPGWYNLGQFIPLWLRLTIGALIALASVRWLRLTPLAVTLVYPVLWFHSLSTLVAVFTPASTPGTNRSEPGMTRRHGAR